MFNNVSLSGGATPHAGEAKEPHAKDPHESAEPSDPHGKRLTVRSSATSSLDQGALRIQREAAGRRGLAAGMLLGALMRRINARLEVEDEPVANAAAGHTERSSSSGSTDSESSTSSKVDGAKTPRRPPQQSEVTRRSGTRRSNVKEAGEEDEAVHQARRASARKDVWAEGIIEAGESTEVQGPDDRIDSIERESRVRGIGVPSRERGLAALRLGGMGSVVAVMVALVLGLAAARFFDHSGSGAGGSSSQEGVNAGKEEGKAQPRSQREAK